jgi:hypothetical protein
VFGFYSFYQIIPIFYNQEELRGFFEAQAFKSKKYSTSQIKKNVERELRKLGISEIYARNLIINNSGNKVKISMKYEAVFAIDLNIYMYGNFYYEIYKFQMNPQAEVILIK